MVKSMSKRTAIIIAVVCLAAGAAIGQVVDLRTDSDVRGELESLRQEVAELKEQLREISALGPIQQLIAQERRRMEQEAADNMPLDVTIDVASAHFKGEKDAAITVLEFSDYQCPACGSFAQRIGPMFDENFVNTGKAKVVFMDFPLQRHEQAFKAAEAANCAAEQGKFWEYHDQLFANQQSLMPNDLVAHARTLSLNVGAFETCLNSNKHADKIRSDMERAESVRLRGTPHFAIGYTTGNGNQVQVIRAMSGASYQRLEETVNELMAAK